MPVLCYGFYRPEVAVPLAAPAVRDSFFERIQRPIQTPDDLIGLLETTAEAVPVLRPLSLHLREQGIQVEFGPTSPVLNLSLPARSYKIRLPEATAPASYFSNLIPIFGQISPLPKGLHRLPFSGRDAASFRAGFWRSTSWNLALGRSFLFQCALEMDRSGLARLHAEPEVSLLDLKDLVLFRIFREEGLVGLMAGIREIMSPSALELLEGNVQTIVGNLMAGGFDSVPDGPAELPDLGEPYNLPRTFLDEGAEQVASWGRGAYQGTANPGPIERKRQRELMELMLRPLRSNKDLSLLFTLIREIAPEMAPALLALYREGKVLFQIGAPSPRGTGGLVISFESCFKLPSDHPPLIQIARGTTIANILTWVVGDLAVVGLPPTINDTHRLTTPRAGETEFDVVLRYLDEKSRTQLAWAASAKLEFVSLAIKRGMLDRLPVYLERIKEVLEKNGLAALIDLVQELVDKEDWNNAHIQNRLLARAVVAAGALPVLCRIHAGEAVPEEEWKRFSDRVSWAFSQILNEKEPDFRRYDARGDRVAARAARQAEEPAHRQPDPEVARRLAEARDRLAREAAERTRQEIEAARNLALAEDAERRLREEESERLARAASRTSLLHHRREVEKLLTRLEDEGLLELNVRGIISDGNLTAPKIELRSGSETRILFLRSTVEREAQAIVDRFELAEARPLQERGATKGFPEEMRALVERIRADLLFVSRYLDSARSGSQS